MAAGNGADCCHCTTDSATPVTYFTGRQKVNSPDLVSYAFGQPFGQIRAWTGLNESSQNGNGWMDTDLPYLVVKNNQYDNGIVTVVQGQNIAKEFAVPFDGWQFSPRYAERGSFVYVPPITDGAGHHIPGEFHYTDAYGNITVFNDLPRDSAGGRNALITDPNGNEYYGLYGGNGYAQQVTQQWYNTSTGARTDDAYFKYRYGAFKSFTNAASGLTVTATYDADGNLDAVTRTDGVAYEQFDYTYSTWTNPSSGASAPLISNVVLEKGTNSSGPWTKVRSVDYTYYTGDPSLAESAYGRLGDLKLVTIKDYQHDQQNPVVVDQKYYRYNKFAGEQYDGQTGTTDYHTRGPTNAYLLDGNGNPVLDGNGFHQFTSGGTDSTFPQAHDDDAIMSGLKSVFEGAAFDRLAAGVGSSYQTATDAAVDGYANFTFQYERVNPVHPDTHYPDAYGKDTRYRVIGETAAANGCSTCGGGFGTYKFDYYVNQPYNTYDTSQNAFETNTWSVRTTEYLPDDTVADWADNDQNIVYTNELGEVILKVVVDRHGTDSTADDQAWPTFYQYDGQGRLTMTAYPSALAHYDPSDPSNFEDAVNELTYQSDLVGYDPATNTYQNLNANTGLIELTDYGQSTTATTTSTGDVTGYLKDTEVRRGYNGTPVTLTERNYIAAPQGGNDYLVASDTQYRTDDPASGQTTSYAYTFFPGSNAIASKTVTNQIVSASQNGPGAADVGVYVYDMQGRVTWTKIGDTDADGNGLLDNVGVITAYQYDPATGAVNQIIDDVDTTRVSNEPAGWLTASGGGLHLITSMIVDGLGRTTKLTDPQGNVTYTVYNDAAHEMRTYRGWTGTTTTGPIEVTREYRNGTPDGSGIGRVYTETLTSSATPTVSGGAPTGQETIDGTNIQSLSRSLTNNAGQVVQTDAYFSMAGLTYSQSTPILRLTSDPNNDPPPSNDSGTGNYHATFIAYDDRGRVNRVEAPTGTITRTIYDGQNRVTSVWVGTNDAANGEWAPGNNTGTANMGRIADYIYDNGGIGDGNLTEAIQHVQYLGSASGAGTGDRNTDSAYDWRDRLIAMKQGVQASESTTDNTHPITYLDLDNLGEVTSTQQYDGDTISIADANGDGIPDQPASSLLRAQTTTSYDDLGRVFSSEVWDVDPVNGGNPTAGLVTGYWYDHRGNLIKTSAPGGLVTKTLYDGADRATKVYQTDGGGDQPSGSTVTSNWSGATTVNGDIVLTQTETQYDGDGNAIFVITKDRFHNAVPTGALGDPGSDNVNVAPARDYYVENFYDAADRLTGTANLGTNGGTILTARPDSDASLLVRSDTKLVTNYYYAASETQTLRITGDPTGGTFTLTINGDTTTPLAYNASATAVNQALAALPSIGGNSNVVTTWDANDKAYTVEFIGALEAQNLPQITANSSLTGGNSPGIAIATAINGGGGGWLVGTIDPKDHVTLINADALGRTTKTVEGYVNGVPSAADDQTTEMTYDGDGHVLTMQADLPDGALQQTAYIYDTQTGMGSSINSKDILTATQYPDPSTGQATAASQELYTVDAAGERTTFTDRNGTMHVYTHDVLGRLTSDAATAANGNPWNIDTSIASLGYTFDSAGRPFQFTSYNSTGGVVNQVERIYNGLGQLITEYQEHSGAVNTGTSPALTYAYHDITSGGNNSRLESVTYPDDSVLSYEYGSSGSLDDTISRLSGLKFSFVDWGNTELETYQYLGLSTVVVEDRPDAHNQLTYVMQDGYPMDAGDQYTGLDRFGRIVDQRWINTSLGTDTDRYQYGYDRDGNRIWKDNLLTTNEDEFYAYDSINRLTEADRGELNASRTGLASSAVFGQQWTLSATGNWDAFYQYTTQHLEHEQYRTSDAANELSSINDIGTLGNGVSNLAYDANGNMTTDENGHVLSYDAWNRLAKVVTRQPNGTDQGEWIRYSRDALGRLLRDSHMNGMVPVAGPDNYYDGQHLIERYNPAAGLVEDDYVWGTQSENQLVLRQRGPAYESDPDQRLYIQQDANLNVTSVVGYDGLDWMVKQRYAYDP